MEAIVYNKGIEAGVLVKKNGKYIFTYNDFYFGNASCQSISLTLPKIQKEFISEHLFSFFFNMLPEGVNKKLICRNFKIDENDHFGLLLQVGQEDTIGSVTVKPKHD